MGLLQGLPNERDQEKMAMLLEREAWYLRRRDCASMAGVINMVLAIVRRVFADIRYEIVEDLPGQTLAVHTAIPATLPMHGTAAGLDEEVETCAYAANNLASALAVYPGIIVGRVPIKISGMGTQLMLSVEFMAL